MPASKRKRQGPLHFPVRIPFVEELGLELWHAGDGTSELRVDLDEAHLNSWEVAHGGVLMTLLDVAMAQAARTMHRDGERFGPSVVTIEMKTTFVHPAEGLLTGLPADRGEPTFDFRRIEAGELATLSAEELDRAARDYLDVNCAHCHNPSGVQGQTSQLFLNRQNTDRFRLGVCKRPGSAGSGTGGLTYDLVPGSPEESILLFRMETEEVGAMMPLLGRSVRHDEGVELIRAWIAAMPAETCE